MSVATHGMHLYNPRVVPGGQGMPNLGNTCYFNSLMQCMLSCPSIFETLAKMEARRDKYFVKNALAQHLLAMHRAASAGEQLGHHCQNIWRQVLAISAARKDRIRLVAGAQNDVSEGLMLLLDCFDYLPEVKRLFQHRHMSCIKCSKCNEWVSKKKEQNLTFEVQPGLQTEQHAQFADSDPQYRKSRPLGEFLSLQNGYIDEGYRCPKCEDTGVKFRTTQLTMVPEILPVLIKKYKDRRPTQFPLELTFDANGSMRYVYELVAQSEHSGSMAGGHYWALGKRSNGWYVLNDLSVAPGSPGPTPNSYVLFYHITRVE